MSARALVAAYQGDGDAALEQCGVSLRLASLLRHEPTLISHLVNIASQGIAVLTANHTLRVAETSPDARARLDGMLANLDNRQGTIDAMKGERAMGILTFQQMRSGTLDPSSLGGGGGGSGFSVVSSTWLGQAYLNDDEAKYIEILDKQIEAAELPKQERDAAMQPVWDDLQQSRFRHVFCRLLVPALYSAANASDRVEASNRCLRVLLAVEDQEDFDLQDIDLPATAKTDPFSGGPLLMSRKEGGLVVYSVFKNLRDDGGDVYFSKGDPLDIGLGPLLEPLAEDAGELDEP